MDEELISVIDLATQLGRRKQTVFKVIRRLGIEAQMLANGNSRGATMAYVTHVDADRICDELGALGGAEGGGADDGDGSKVPAQRAFST